VSQTGTTTSYFYPFKWYSVASSTGSGAKYAPRPQRRWGYGIPMRIPSSRLIAPLDPRGRSPQNPKIKIRKIKILKLQK
jgi:hypothetical protein